MAAGPSNDVLLQRLRDGTAEFVLLETGSASALPRRPQPGPFARIGPSLAGASRKRVEHYYVHKVAGDGRCMFRALARGMATSKGLTLSKRQETADAVDELRMAVKEVICESEEERHMYEDALIAITVEESLKRYCHRIERSDFWGGESELLVSKRVLSRLCHQPIIVYIPEHEHTRGGMGGGVIPIAEYGSEFGKARNGRKPVRLLYSGKKHYDLLT